MRILQVIALCVFITGCSWTDFLKVLTPSSGIQAELVLGDKNQEIKTEIGSQSAGQIINIDETPIWLILFAVAGWILPSPQEIYRKWRSKSSIP